MSKIKKISFLLLFSLVVSSLFAIVSPSPTANAAITKDNLGSTIDAKCSRINGKGNPGTLLYDICSAKGKYYARQESNPSRSVKQTDKKGRAIRLLALCHGFEEALRRATLGDAYNRVGTVRNGDCDDIKKSDEIQKIAYPEAASGGTVGNPESTVGEGGSGGPAPSPAATPSPSGGPTDPGGETPEDEAVPTRNLNQDKVTEELKAGEIKLTDEERKKAGILAGIDDSKIVSGILNMVYTIASVIAIIVIVASGIMIMTADGDQQKVATGRQAIVYACICLVIVGSAFIITGIIVGIGTT